MSKKINLLITLLLAVAVLNFFSCKKSDPVTDNSGAPTLSITSPAQGAVLDSVVHITGVAQAPSTDDAHLLHELSLTVKKASDNTIVWTSIISVHDDYTYNIDTSLIIPRAGVSVNYVLNAQVVNHIIKYGTQNVNFTINP